MTEHTLTLTTQTRSGADELRALLETAERDLGWLSRKSGYSQSHLWRVINEGRRISADLAARLAVLFDVPAETFLADQQETDQ